MEFVAGDLVRMGFGFFNPNHAAAAICALFPFCWGWGGKWQWAGRLVAVALCVMLAMTYSRTGMAVLAIEAVVLWQCGALGTARPTSGRGRVRARVPTMSIAVVVAAIAAWWMWPRLALDGAVMNRPKIWLAGLRLFAVNQLGVGFGNSGEIASAFMLPDGIVVRTLVNSHLTLLAEMGAFVGGAWLAFIALALCVGRKLRRTWVAFAGLALSALSASVFDWHVLFDFKEMGGFGLVNFVLAWALFVAFVGMGGAMVVVGVGDYLAQRRRDAEMARDGVKCVGVMIGSVAIVLCAAVVGLRSCSTPKVDGEYVVGGALGTARPTVLCVYRSKGWSLKSVAKRFPDGARICIRPGVPENAEDSGDVWLFGEVAEASHRFPHSSVAVVDPPEFYEPERNVSVR